MNLPYDEFTDDEYNAMNLPRIMFHVLVFSCFFSIIYHFSLHQIEELKLCSHFRLLYIYIDVCMCVCVCVCVCVCLRVCLCVCV